MISSIISRLVILVFGTLYPAYASYKAVRTKNVKEYVKWMMYWIVFALFTCAETFTDVFCSFWFPFYYEFKVILVLWLLSPATKGSSILYRKFVHPMLTKREQEIDEYIAKAKEQGYHTVLTLGSKGVNYATTVIMQTAIKGGGGLVNQLRRSYSLSDISADMDALAEMNRIKALPEDELDIADTPLPKDARLRRSRGYSPRRSASGSGRVEMYFPEVDVNVRQRSTRPRETGIPLSHIRSNEDVSSGYSSAEMLYSGHPPVTEAQEPLVRTSSVGSSRVTRTKVARGGAIPKRPTAAEDNLSRSESEESDTGTQEEHFYDVAPGSHSKPIDTLPSSTLSQSVPSHNTGSDFKSHLPVALEGEPKENPVLQSEEDINCTDVLQKLINSTVDQLEEKSTEVRSHSNQEEEKKQDIGETLPDEKTNLEEGKSSEGEFNEHTSYSELADVDKECQIYDKEVPSSDSEVPYLEVVADTEDTKTQEIISLPETVNCDALVIEASPSTNICVPQELEDIEFYDTDSDVGQNTMADHNSNLPGGLEIDNSPSLSEDGKENQPVNNIIPPIPNVTNTNEHLDPQNTCFIPTTVHCKEVVVMENISKNITQDPEDNEFFDTETDLLQNPPALADNNIAPVASECSPPSINEAQNEDEDKLECFPHSIIEAQNEDDKLECSPPSINEAQNEDDKLECSPPSINEAQNEDEDKLECSPPSIIEAQNEDLAENNVQKSFDDTSKEGRAGRYNKHPAPSPPLKASTEDLQLITHKDEPESESNLRHELVVPDHKSPSPKRDKSRSKSPQCSLGINETNTNDKSEQKSSLIIEQVAPTDKVNTYNPVTSYTDIQDMRPSEYYYNQYRAQSSPKQSKKETKSKQDTKFFSRILSKPRSTIASFLPFFSSREEPQPLCDAMTTSLTSLDDMRAQEHMRSSSIAGTVLTSSEFMSTPPELPPRRRTPEHGHGNQVNIREMSHSPTRH